MLFHYLFPLLTLFYFPAHPLTFCLLYFSVINFHYLLLKNILYFFGRTLFSWNVLPFPVVLIILVIVHWSIFMLATSKFLPDNTNICIISELAFINHLFSFKLKLLYLFIWQVNFHCILNILAVIFEIYRFRFYINTRTPLTAH